MYVCAHVCVSHHFLSSPPSPAVSQLFYLFHFHAWIVTLFSMPTFLNVSHPCSYVQLTLCFSSCSMHFLLLEDKADKKENLRRQKVSATLLQRKHGRMDEEKLI